MQDWDDDGCARCKHMVSVLSRSDETSRSFPIEDEKQYEFSIEARRTRPDRCFIDVDPGDIGEIPRPSSNPGVNGSDAWCNGFGCSRPVSMVNECLPIPDALSIQVRRGEMGGWVGSCDVLSGVADLDDFQIVGTREDSMSNSRRLGHTVSGSEHEWLTLILVHHGHRAASAVDQLERDLMEVHIIGDRSRTGNTNVRCDHSTTLTIGYQIAVVHAGTSEVPGIVLMGEGERADESWQAQGCRSWDEFDLQPIGTLPDPLCEQNSVVDCETDEHRSRKTGLEVHSTSKAHESAPHRIVSGKDRFHPQPQ